MHILFQIIFQLNLKTATVYSSIVLLSSSEFEKIKKRKLVSYLKELEEQISKKVELLLNLEQELHNLSGI